jgi:hypothetical protein
VFQFIALTAVVAYLGVYRTMREGRADAGGAEVRRIG